MNNWEKTFANRSVDHVYLARIKSRIKYPRASIGTRGCHASVGHEVTLDHSRARQYKHFIAVDSGVSLGAGTNPENTTSCRFSPHESQPKVKSLVISLSGFLARNLNDVAD